MKTTFMAAGLIAILATLGLARVVQAAAMEHDCTLRDPPSETRDPARRASRNNERNAQPRTTPPLRYSMHVASLDTAHAHLRSGNANGIIHDDNLRGMFESAVGDHEPLMGVIRTDWLITGPHGSSPEASAHFRARITVTFEDRSEVDFLVTPDYPIARYIVGSARTADGVRLADDRCSGTAVR